MDIRDYMGVAFDERSWEEAQPALIADIVSQLERAGVKVEETMPNAFSFRVVAQSTDAEGIDRFALVKVGDVTQDPFWFNNVGIRRMSSIRDWKGDAVHASDWSSVGRRVAELLTPEHDDEIL